MSPAARAPLTRDRVLADAVALADAEGVEAVSMRRLAERLGVVPMALYKHVADKDDLLDGMVDVVIGEMRSPATGADDDSAGDWRDAVRSRLLEARATLGRHAWARQAIESRTVRTPAVLGHMEALTSVLLAGGLSPDLVHHAMHALGNRIWGFSPELFNPPAGASAPARPRTSPAPDPADYPGIIAVTTDARGRRPGAVGCDEDFEFAFALDLLLDGVAHFHDASWQSPSHA